jgi:hypothetical protein
MNFAKPIKYIITASNMQKLKIDNMCAYICNDINIESSSSLNALMKLILGNLKTSIT